MKESKRLNKDAQLSDSFPRMQTFSISFFKSGLLFAISLHTFMYYENKNMQFIISNYIFFLSRYISKALKETEFSYNH